MDAFLRPAEIKRRAKEAGLPASELCKRAGISVVTLWRWEKNKNKSTPSIDIYQRLILVITEAEKARDEQAAPAVAAE